MSVGLFYDESVLLHDDPYSTTHPECSRRINSIMKKFDESGFNEHFKKFSGRKATKDELLKVHTKEYVNKLVLSLTSDAGRIDFVMNADDIYVNEHSLLASLISAGMAIDGANYLLSNKLKHAIILTRPPGHHAHKDRAGGFCLINNIALATKILANAGKKVAVFDWDVHYGDGTADILNKEKNVIFVTMQRYDDGTFYPKTGKTIVKNNMASIGFNGTITGHEYITLFNKQILPILTGYKPDIICISAGFDAARNDPLGGCELDEEDYKYMTSKLMKVAPQILVCLEGGYNLESLACGMRGVAYELLKDTMFKKEKM